MDWSPSDQAQLKSRAPLSKTDILRKREFVQLLSDRAKPRVLGDLCRCPDGKIIAVMNKERIKGLSPAIRTEIPSAPARPGAQPVAKMMQVRPTPR